KLVDELGLKEKTLIIFTSDNGGHKTVWKEFNTNGPLRGYKRNLTEGGIRVPFIARWPGKVPAGKSSHEIIAFQDMMPTFAELAGVNCPDNIDGISVVNALLGGEVKNPHKYLYWDYGHCRSRYDQAVRLSNWKGIRLGRQNKIQLYDLSTDVSEETDVANMHPEVIGHIETIMQTAVNASERYSVGQRYTGGPIWKKK
ncbi:MAG: sulfatase/phosphatase domain-containing protein, partial [Planctomycetota bacterium]